MSPMYRIPLALPLFLISMLAITADAAVLRNETTGGDLSNNRNAPTPFTLSLGSNEIFATTGGSDLEYFTVTVPANQQLRQLFLRAYTGLDPTAFIGVQNGTTFTEDPNSANPANLRGYTHFGPGFVNADMLPAIGTGFGAQGFAPPLGAGSYTFWVQQLGSPATYQLDFVTVPEPGISVLAAGLSISALARRRRSR